MKKILSFVLVLAMIASMMCVSVSAANFIGTHKGVNDEGVDLGSVEDGVDWFASKETSASVVATVDSKVINKYAVDLEFSVQNITLDGQSVWNVNTLRYDCDELTLTIDDEEFDLTNTTATAFEVGSFKATNYSDLSVDVAIAVVMPVKDIVPIVAAIDNASATVKGAYDGTNTADTGVAAVGTAKEFTATATITSSDWARAVAQLNSIQQNGEVTIATYTFSVVPTNPDHRTAPQN